MKLAEVPGANSRTPGDKITETGVCWSTGGGNSANGSLSFWRV